MAEHEAELQSSSSMAAAAVEDEDKDEDRDDDDGEGSPAAFTRSFTSWREFLLLAAVDFVNLVLAGSVELKMENSALKLLLVLVLTP